MDVLMDHTTVRLVCKAAQCAAKIGNEILLEIVAGESLSLRSLNSSRSAFFNMKIRVDSFTYFRVTEPCIQVAVATKAFMAALRTPKVNNIRLTLEGSDLSRLCFQLESAITGVKKKYSVPVLSDVEFLSANIDKSTYAARFTAKPNVLTRLFANFATGGTNDVSVTCSNNSRLVVASHAESLQRGGGDAMLTTSMELETADEDIEYHFNGTGSKKLSFNLSDFKAMLAFCTDVHTDVVVHLDEPGKPVVVVPSFLRMPQRADSDFLAEMVLATMEYDNQAAQSGQISTSQRSNQSNPPHVPYTREGRPSTSRAALHSAPAPFPTSRPAAALAPPLQRGPNANAAAPSSAQTPRGAPAAYQQAHEASSSRPHASDAGSHHAPPSRQPSPSQERALRKMGELLQAHPGVQPPAPIPGPLAKAAGAACAPPSRQRALPRTLLQREYAIRVRDAIVKRQGVEQDPGRNAGLAPAAVADLREEGQQKRPSRGWMIDSRSSSGEEDSQDDQDDVPATPPEKRGRMEG